ncbi:MAG: ABC transporter transmembrane domain-containing protein, partial [Verrucomicrobiota bacterium]
MKSNTFRIFSYLKGYPGLASAQLACAISATVLVVVFPKILEIIIDDVIPNEMHRLGTMVAIALGAFLFREVFDSLRIQLNNTFEQKVIYDLRSDLYQHIQKLPLQWFDNHPTGDTMTCVSEDVQSMERVLIDGIEQGLVSALQILIVGGVLFSIHGQLAASALSPIPLLLIGAWWYRKNRQNHSKLRKATGEMNSLLHDNIAGIRQIKAYALEES